MDEGKAYKKQAKAPPKGSKADDADEYQASDSKYKETDKKSKAYSNQDKAPTGRGKRGPTQADGGPIAGWDKSTPNYGAYDSQEKWADKSDSASLGFKRSEGHAYMGHFANEDVLRKGHNESGNLSDVMFGGASSPTPNKRSGDEDGKAEAKQPKKGKKSPMNKYNWSDDE